MRPRPRNLIALGLLCMLASWGMVALVVSLFTASALSPMLDWLGRACFWGFLPAQAVGGFLLAWGLHAWDSQRRKHAPARLCVRCSYDLCGLAAGAPCPECGKKAPA